MQTTKTLSAEVLALPLSGSHVDGARTLGELLSDPTLLAFLRHGG